MIKRMIFLDGDPPHGVLDRVASGFKEFFEHESSLLVMGSPMDKSRMRILEIDSETNKARVIIITKDEIIIDGEFR